MNEEKTPEQLRAENAQLRAEKAALMRRIAELAAAPEKRSQTPQDTADGFMFWNEA